MWKSIITGDENSDDNGAIVHIFNENTSWHGHTVLAIEYNNSSGANSFWGLSFQPKNEGEGKPLLLVGGVQAKLVERTGFGQSDPGLQGSSSSTVLSYVIPANQKSSLAEVIEREKGWIANNTVIYATIGIPVLGLFMTGYRDTCYSWAIRVLRDAGIISSMWVLSRPLSMAPATGNLYGKTVNYQSGDGMV